MDKDQELLIGLKQKREDAQREFFNRYYNQILGYLCGKARCRSDAEEILNDTFFRAFTDIHRFEGRSTLKTWLFRIAEHAAIDFYRSRRNRYLTSSKKNVQEDSPAVTSISSRVSGDPEQVAEVKERERLEKLKDCLKRLSEEHSRVITLRFFEGRSIKETARIMDKTEAAIKMLSVRALKNLSGIVKDHPYFKEGGNLL